tara:strand:+ start:172355 stop:173716 length:1362 start_codon:yes stop_codon:yes gene_type:complete
MNEIGLKRYRLLFYGNILDEADPASAKRALAERYRLTTNKLEACFSGRKVALHSDLSERDAYRLQGELEDDGLITHLELLDHASRSAESKQASADAPLPRAVFATTTNNSSPAPIQSGPTSSALHPNPPAHDASITCTVCLNVLNPENAKCPNCGTIKPATAATTKQRSIIIAKFTLAGLVLSALVAGATWLALPLYQQQQNHVHVRNAISQAEDVSDQLRAFIDKTGFWPNSNLDAGLGAPDSFQSKAIASIRIGSKALILVTFNDNLNSIGGQTLLFIPQRDTDQIVHWRCDGGTLEPQWRPTECTAPEHSEYQRQDTAEPLTLAESIPAITSSTDTTGPSERKIQRLLRDEISKTLHVRQAVMQMKVMDGLWPATNAEAALPAARLIGSSAFRKVEVQPEGRILYVFSDQIPSFEGHKLWLVPSSIGEWRCEASFEDRYLPTPCSASISH